MNESEFTQDELQNAVHRIKGYHGVPRGRQKHETVFKAAKAELLRNLRRDIAAAKAVTFETFNKIGPSL